MVATMTEKDGIEQRRSQPANALASETIRWLAKLPAGVRPSAMPTQYPRIANTLATVWSDHKTCLEYLEGLLIDQRGGRHGFPIAVALELAGVKDHYETKVYPTPQTVWDLIVERH